MGYFALSRKGCGEHVEDAEMKQVLLFYSCYPDSAKQRPGVWLPFIISHPRPALLRVCCSSESWIFIVLCHMAWGGSTLGSVAAVFWNVIEKGPGVQLPRMDIGHLFFKCTWWEAWPGTPSHSTKSANWCKAGSHISSEPRLLTTRSPATVSSGSPARAV